MKTTPATSWTRTKTWTLVPAMAGAIVLVIASCGTSSDNSSKSSSGAPSGQQSGYAEVGGKNVSDTADKVAAQRAPRKVPSANIGLVLVTGTEGAQRDAAGVKDAARLLGWNVDTVDANGDVQKMQSTMANFVNEKKDGIVMVALPTASVGSQLAAAKRARIPVINIAAVDADVPGVSAQYAVNAQDAGNAAAKRLLSETKPGDTVAMLTTISIAAQRATDEQIRNQLKAAGRKIVENSINLDNLANDVQTSVNAVLASHPDLTAIWADVSAEPGIIEPILKSRSLCGKVKVFSSLWTSQTIAGIQDGCITGTVASPAGFLGYLAVDQIAQYLSNSTTPMPDVQAVATKWGIDFENGDSIRVVDQKALGSTNHQNALTPTYDYRSFFRTLWSKQFGIKAN